MIAPIGDSSLRRYASLVSGIIQNTVGMAICDISGHPVQTHDFKEAGEVKDALGQVA